MSRRKPRAETPARVGRPTNLTPDVHERFIQALSIGVPYTQACRHTGIGVRAFAYWMSWGRDEIAARDAGMAPDHRQDVYVRFAAEVEKARAAVAVRNLANITKVSGGGFVTKTRTRTFKDPITGKPVTEVEEDIAAPDFKAASWLLERSFRADFGPNAQTIALVRQSDGLPLPEDFDPQAESGDGEDVFSDDLARRIAKHIADAGAQAALTAGGDDGVVDAEVVGES